MFYAWGITEHLPQTEVLYNKVAQHVDSQDAL